MAAVAVEALGGVGIAQPVDLPVIAREIGLLLLLVAGAAVLGDEHPHRVALGRLDVMGGVAVGADGRRRVFPLRHGLAMGGGQVGVLLLFVAAPADLGVLEPVIGARLTAQGADAVRIVTVVAGGVGARLVLLVGAGMDRVHVAVDLLHDDPEALVLGVLGPGAGLILLPGLLVALHTAHQDLRGVVLVLGVRDVGVAANAQLLAMNARGELVWMHVDIDDGAVVALDGLILLVPVTLEALLVGNVLLAGLGVDSRVRLFRRCRRILIGIVRGKDRRRAEQTHQGRQSAGDKIRGDAKHRCPPQDREHNRHNVARVRERMGQQTGLQCVLRRSKDLPGLWNLHAAGRLLNTPESFAAKDGPIEALPSH